MNTVPDSVNSDEFTHRLYRCYDADGVLLYIGVSKSWADRMYAHHLSKPWWDDVVDVRLTPVTEADAYVWEREAIEAEQPRYNVVHNRDTTEQHGKVSKVPVSIRDGHFDAMDALFNPNRNRRSFR